MSDKKHIDRLFQERFKDFETAPSDTVWKNIETVLGKEKKKRRIIPIWWQYAGVAAVLALLLTVGGTYFYNSDKNTPINVVDTDENQTRSFHPKNDIKIAVENKTSNENNLEKITENDANTVSKTAQVSKASTVLQPLQVVVTSEEKNTLQNGVKSNKTSTVKTTLISTNKAAIASTSEEKNKALPNSNDKNSSENNKKSSEVIALIMDTEKAKDLIQNTSENVTNMAKTDEKSKNTLTIEDALEDTKDAVKEEKMANKWRITPQVAPVYFNSLGEGSSIDSQFNSNSKTGEVNMSYGISASYAIHEKLKVRSGINKVNLGYNTNNVVMYQSVGLSANAPVLEHVIAKKGNKPETISLVSNKTINTAPEGFATANTSLNQAFSYIEVPLEIQYTLVNTKLGINLIGGFSSFFLSDNAIFSRDENGSSVFLGEANNMNTISYSANFGVGFNYQVSRKIDLNIEPMFKYQMNTFNNTSGNFTPFFIGVYSGFSIKF